MISPSPSPARNGWLPALGDAIIALRVQEMVDRGELAVSGTDATPDGAVYWRRLRRTDVFPQK